MGIRVCDKGHHMHEDDWRQLERCNHCGCPICFCGEHLRTMEDVMEVFFKPYVVEAYVS